MRNGQPLRLETVGRSRSGRVSCVRVPSSLTYEGVGSSVDPSGPASRNELYANAATSPPTPAMACHRRARAAAPGFA